ncbi:Uncharacterized protein DAT39_022124, partial [Clarias magur]
SLGGSHIKATTTSWEGRRLSRFSSEPRNASRPHLFELLARAPLGWRTTHSEDKDGPK